VIGASGSDDSESLAPTRPMRGDPSSQVARSEARDSADALASMVRLDGVSFAYPSGVLALRDVNLAVRQGRRVAIVGPSGCGKSTLLRLVAGTLSASGGSVIQQGVTDSSRPSRAMVFQSDTLLPWLTVFENAALAFRLRGEKRQRYADWINELLKMVGLEAFSTRYPYELSGGMRRRVAFLAAVAPKPDVLLLDEPFSSLDEPTRLTLHQDVVRITGLFNMTVVLVTHDLAEAISICDEVVLLSRSPGTVVIRRELPFGGTDDLYGLRERPEFLRLYAELWHELSAQIKSSNDE
jgi:NitT/TauT family transport system ATP-binding protein